MNITEREKAVAFFCEQAKVVAKHMHHAYSADCFCDKPTGFGEFQCIEEPVLGFISSAIAEKIAREGRNP